MKVSSRALSFADSSGHLIDLLENDCNHPEYYKDAEEYMNATNEQDGQDEGVSTSYDPMNMPSYGDTENFNKRFKVAEEDDEYDITYRPPVQTQDAPIPVEMDDSNSIRLRKGNLVIRKSLNTSQGIYS